VAEGGGLLNRYTLQRRIEGSNPSGSASPSDFVNSNPRFFARVAARRDGPGEGGAFGFESLRLRQSPYLSSLFISIVWLLSSPPCECAFKRAGNGALSRRQPSASVESARAEGGGEMVNGASTLPRRRARPTRPTRPDLPANWALPRVRLAKGAVCAPNAGAMSLYGAGRGARIRRPGGLARASNALNYNMNQIFPRSERGAIAVPLAGPAPLRVFCATVGRKAPSGPVGMALLDCFEGLNG